MIGLNPDNDRACNKIKKYVRFTYPSSDVCRPRKSWGLNDNDFLEVVKDSISAREVIIKSGYAVAGGAYTIVWKRIDRLKIDTSHFLGQGHTKGKTAKNKKDIWVYLVKDCYSISSHNLKVRLIKEGYKQHRCEICCGTEWMGKPIPISLDHINGDHHDNTITNLRILCPNCHAQTDTFGIRNKKNRKKGIEIQVVRTTGLEPALPFGNIELNDASLPVSPRPPTEENIFSGADEGTRTPTS